MIQLPTLLCPLQPFIEFFPKFDSSSNLEMLENLISIATLIRAYVPSRKKMERKIAIAICLLGTAEYICEKFDSTVLDLTFFQEEHEFKPSS